MGIKNFLRRAGILFAFVLVIVASFTVAVAGDYVHLTTSSGRKVAPDDQVVEFQTADSAVAKQVKALSADDIAAVAARALALESWRNNRVVWGNKVLAPTNASTQGPGAVKAVVRVNYSEGLRVFKGVPREVDATADSQVSSSLIPVLAQGQSVVLAFFLFGSGSTAILAGAPATTGQALVPTDAEIRAYLTGNALAPEFVKVGTCTLDRTGDQTLTQSQDNTWRDF